MSTQLDGSIHMDLVEQSPLAEQSQRRCRDVSSARRLVVKLGTRVLTDDHGRLARPHLRAVVDSVARLHRMGREVLIVSSGAVGLGAEGLCKGSAPSGVALRRACAAVGQSRLMVLFAEELARHDLLCGQILLTQGDFDDRTRYLDLRRTLDTLLDGGVVPILNENDAVTRETLASFEGCGPVFDDNDRLAALVASELDADLLVLLTDIDGVYDRHPREPDARRLGCIEDPRVVAGISPEPGSSAGRGGMASKVSAAAIAARGGCHAVIASGRHSGTVDRILAGDDEGTWFPAQRTLPARRRWIAFAAAPRGVLHLDAGAVEALRRMRASLLPVGVRRVEGVFQRGDVVELRDPEGELVGRGLALYDAHTVEDWCRGQAPTDLRGPNALIRRNHVVLEHPVSAL